MIRSFLIGTAIGLGIIFLFGVGWVLAMGYLNSRTTHLNVQVTGEIDSIRFYQAARPEEPVAEINFSGQNGERTIDLLNSRGTSYFYQMPPTQYFFVTRLGSQSYRSPTICCQTSFFNQSATLVIHGLDQWEKSDNRLSIK